MPAFRCIIFINTSLLQKIIQNIFVVVPDWYDEEDEKIFFSDEGVAALANLPKLEKLELTYAINVTGQVFRNFTTLKELKCSHGNDVNDLFQGLCDFLITCRKIEVIDISNYSANNIKCFFTSAASMLRKRDGGTPLLVHLEKYLVRMSLVRSKKGSSEKISFQMYNFTENYKSVIIVEEEPFLITCDEIIFTKIIEEID